LCLVDAEKIPTYTGGIGLKVLVVRVRRRCVSMATLKVRVRVASGGLTMRVEVAWPFTVKALKDVISPLIM
jgi:hypothetical protein